MTILYLVRKDLRTDDNLILNYISNTGSDSILLYVDDPRDPLKNSTSCLYRNHFLNSFNTNCNNNLNYEKGLTEEIVKNYINTYTINELIFQRQFEPWEVEIEKNLHALSIKTTVIQDFLLLAPENCLNKSNQLYKVFSPYYKTWCNKLPYIHECTYNLKTISFLKVSKHKLDDLPQKTLDLNYKDFFDTKIELYEAYRDYPAKVYTSKVSMLLNFGLVSARRIYLHGCQSKAFIRQLAWREYYTHWLYYNPFVLTDNYKNFKIDWSYDQSLFEAWKKGETGYDLVDAAMKQLNSEGWIHGRLRMITASFLVKDLQIDWRLGEAYFYDKLIDADKALNVGNWQWIAGTGAIIQPYFRILSPDRQIKRFDEHHDYISRYITVSSPKIIEHNIEKERFIQLYKKALSQ